MFGFPVDLSDDEGTVLVKFPDIPEAITFGEDRDEALMRAVDALETALMIYVDKRRPIPRSSPCKGRPMVSPCAMSIVKLSIHQAMVDQGIRKTELARRINCHLPQIDRLLDLNHASRLDQIEHALAVLGLRLMVDVAKAA
jgi:antitoxin HicB